MPSSSSSPKNGQRRLSARRSFRPGDLCGGFDGCSKLALHVTIGLGTALLLDREVGIAENQCEASFRFILPNENLKRFLS